MKILKTDGIVTIEPAYLRPLDGLSVEIIDRPCLTEEELIVHGADADALLVLREPVSAQVIAHLRRCKVISRFGIGVDTIDIPAATAAGIAVANVPNASVDEVSSHIVAMAMSLTRRLDRFEAGLRSGNWDSVVLGAGMQRIADMTFGLIGIGRIGQLVAQKARPFGFKLLAFDPLVDEAEFARHGIVPVNLDELIAASDIISLQVPLTPDTHAIIDQAAIARMKHGALLINASRGGLVDEYALAKALTEGRLGGAGIDAFEVEPMHPDNPLLRAPNLILTPHAAHYSDRSIEEMMTKSLQNVASVLRGERAPYQIN